MATATFIAAIAVFIGMCLIAALPTKTDWAGRSRESSQDREPGYDQNHDRL